MLTYGLPLFHLSPNVDNKTVARQDLTKESKDITYYNKFQAPQHAQWAQVSDSNLNFKDFKIRVAVFLFCIAW